MASKFNASDLLSGAKQLNTVPESKANKNSQTIDSDVDPNALRTFEDIYEKHNGDLNDIFKELNSNPKKAKKHPPKSANEFATKYIQGFYALVDDETTADSKNHK